MKINKKGFTLIELLIVIGIIAILAAIVIIAINPGYQFAQSRDAQRWSNVNTIINAVNQYMIANKGAFPKDSEIDSTAIAICRTNAGSCTGMVDLDDELVPTFIVALPYDPSCADANSTCYTIATTTEDRIIIDAPNAELVDTISVTR